MTTTVLPAVTLLLDSNNRGTHIPRDFVTDFDLSLWGLDETSWAVQTCKQGHDAEFYWDAWDEILNKAKMTTGHTLYQDGDLWAINVAKMSSEELENFELGH